MHREEMGNPDSPIACPYTERIVTLEVQQDRFLGNNGWDKRLRSLEQSRAYFLGIAAGIGITSSFISAVIIRWLGV